VENHCIKVAQNLGRRNAKNTNATRSKPPVADRVAFGLIAARMDFTVYLDREIDLWAIEIE
jgi:hypothetical protein